MLSLILKNSQKEASISNFICNFAASKRSLIIFATAAYSQVLFLTRHSSRNKRSLFILLDMQVHKKMLRDKGLLVFYQLICISTEVERLRLAIMSKEVSLC